MAEIRDLSGKIVEVDKLEADPEVSDLLAELEKKNRKGGIKGLIAVWLTPDDWHGSCWAWERAGGGMLTMLGALAAAQDDLLAARRSLPERFDDPA